MSTTTRTTYTGTEFPTFATTGMIGTDVICADEITTGEYLYLDYDLSSQTRRQFVDTTTRRPLPGATGRATYPLTGENIYRVLRTTTRKVRAIGSGRLVTRTLLSLESPTGETYTVALLPIATIYTASPSA